MNFIETSRFERAYRSLSPDAKGRVKDALGMMAVNIKYPSLHVKKIKGTNGIWEVRAGLDYRITFQVVKDCFILRNVGHYDLTLKNP